MPKQKKRRSQTINVREMRVDDIPAVYRLGHRLFQSQEASTFYRTWDAYEVTNNFNQDPHLTLVAESRKGNLLGFALGTTYENESGGWKYGYILWMGVSPRWQGSGVGSDLYREMERRMHEDGVRMTFVDTARSNVGAIKFFKRMGYGRPEAEVWMSKIIQRTRKPKTAVSSIQPGRRKRHLGRHRKASLRRRTGKSQQ
ncbi:MAG TPA: N-acetyltransferase [Candidatus Binatia bacterium]|jgi:ribosomal protein S18 acetylase RimI-like enzyme